MHTDDLVHLVQRLSSVEIDTLDRDELASVVAAATRVRGWLDTIELRCSRRSRTLAAAGRSEPAPALIARHSGRSSRDAEQLTRRDRIAEAMPAFETALEGGDIATGHLDAIANATRNSPVEIRAAFALHEHELLAHATDDTVDTFTRRCRALVTELITDATGNDATELEHQRTLVDIRTWIDATNGMHHTHATLDPLRHEIFWTAINRTIRRRQQLDGNARTPWNQLQADALLDAVTGRLSGAVTRPTDATQGRTPRPPEPSPSPAADIARQLADAIDRSEPLLGRIDDKPPDDQPPEVGGDSWVVERDVDIEAELRVIEQRVPEVSVLTDLSFLLDIGQAHGVHETENGVCLPISTIRRLCCDAEVIPIVLGGDGVPVDLGRSARTVNRAQRRALCAMHRTCINPDCSVPFSRTTAHHILWWKRDTGPTDIDNLAPLCERCHHLVHEGGWILTMTPDRVATWIRPDGTIHHTGPTIDRRPPAGPGP